MKIYGNINFFYFLIKNLSLLGPHRRKILALKAAGKKEEERQAIYEVCNYFVDKVMKKLNWKMNIINPENLPEKGPVVYVSNHQSYVDIAVFLHIPKHQVGLIAKEELTKIPIFSKWALIIEGLFIKRGDARASLATINEGAEKLKDGYSLVIFPEGTRSQSTEMGEFKAGALKLATKAKATIIPVTIKNSYKAFEEKGTIQKDKTIDILIHEAIDTSKLDRKELAELNDRLENTIRSGL